MITAFKILPLPILAEWDFWGYMITFGDHLSLLYKSTNEFWHVSEFCQCRNFESASYTNPALRAVFFISIQ